MYVNVYTHMCIYIYTHTMYPHTDTYVKKILILVYLGALCFDKYFDFCQMIYVNKKIMFLVLGSINIIKYI